MPDEITIDDLLAEITARESEARVLLRQDLLLQHAVLCTELEATVEVDAKENRDPLAPAIAQQILDLEAEIDASRRVFKFRSIGSRPWKDLLGRHPPLKEQRQQFGNGLDYNPSTFPAAAIAASCISPQMTAEQVAKFEALMEFAEFDKLWAAARDANTGGDANPKSLVAGRIVRVSEQFETMRAVSLESPDLSSLDG